MALEAALLRPSADQLRVLVMDVEQLLHVRHQIGICNAALRLDEREADVGDVLAHDVADGWQPRRDAENRRNSERSFVLLSRSSASHPEFSFSSRSCSASAAAARRTP